MRWPGVRTVPWRPIADDLPSEVIKCLGDEPSPILDIGCNGGSTSELSVETLAGVSVIAFLPDMTEARTALEKCRHLPVSVIASAVTGVVTKLPEPREGWQISPRDRKAEGQTGRFVDTLGAYTIVLPPQVAGDQTEDGHMGCTINL